MRLLRLALLLGAVVLAVAAEWVSYEAGDLALVVADGVVGLVLVTCGIVAWERRGESRVGPLMVLSGYTWFAGNLWSQLLYLHRGPLVHLHISYPTGRLRRRLAQVTVGAAYVDALVLTIAENDVLTLVLAALVAAAALEGYLRASGTARRAGIPALAAALAFAGVLAFGAVERLAGWDADRAALWAYDIVIASLAVVLLVDLLRGRWAEAVVADLVVDLGKRADTRTLRDELGRALGDRSLVLGYWLPEEERYVDDAGRPVELPEPGAGRAVTPARARRTAGRRPRPRRGGAGGSCARRGRRLGREDGRRERPPSGGGAGTSPRARRLPPPDRRGRGRAEAPPRAGAQRRRRAPPRRGRRDSRGDACGAGRPGCGGRSPRPRRSSGVPAQSSTTSPRASTRAR